MANWEGKLALVTGAAGGIGSATTTALLSLGASVVALDVAKGALESACAGWNGGDRVVPVVGDVSKAADVAAAFEAAERTGRELVALVACAGAYGYTLAEEMPSEEWHRVLRTNLRGTFLCCRAAARTMIPRRTGAVVTLSSSLAYAPALGRAHYAASKAAIPAFTRSLALELAPHGARANCIAPGAIDTPMPRSIPGRSEAAVQAMLLGNPLHQIGSAQDVANLIVFLLSPESRHITGQVIHINGGALMP